MTIVECKQPGCSLIATRGDYCVIHFAMCSVCLRFFGCDEMTDEICDECNDKIHSRGEDDFDAECPCGNPDCDK